MSSMLKIVIPLLVALFVVGFLVGGTFYSRTITVEKVQKSEPLKVFTVDQPVSTEIRVPAVDENNKGVTTLIGVQAETGTGRTLVNLDVLSYVDTQDSIRIARQVAEDVTGLDLSRTDLTYTIRANASVIEGPSTDLQSRRH